MLGLTPNKVGQDSGNYTAILNLLTVRPHTTFKYRALVGHFVGNEKCVIGYAFPCRLNAGNNYGLCEI